MQHSTEVMHFLFNRMKQYVENHSGHLTGIFFKRDHAISNLNAIVYLPTCSKYTLD